MILQFKTDICHYTKSIKMKIPKTIKTSLFTLAITLPFGCTSVSGYTKNSNGIILTADEKVIEINFFSPEIVRVVKIPVGKKYEKESLIVTKKPSKTKLRFSDNDSTIIVKSSKVNVVVNKITGDIEFCDKNGVALTKEKPSSTLFTPITDAKNNTFRVKESFLLDKDEAIYGVGQIMDNKMNRRESKHHLQNENMFTSSPYIHSVKGYAIYFDNYSISEFEAKDNTASYECIGDASDYYFLYGDGNADGVIARTRELTGDSPMLPLWSYGYFQSKERYVTQNEGLDIVKKYRELEVPFDVLIQDWRYWPEYHNDSVWNAHCFDQNRFPDPQKWVNDIHDLNAKLLIVAWPGFAPLSPQYDSFKSKGMLYDFSTWPPNSGARPYDVFNPEARQMYWESLNKGIFSYIGNDGWWLDSTEPDHIDRKDTDYDQCTYLGSYRSVKNAYSIMHNHGISTNQKKTNKDKRVVILTRSGFVGQQRYGSNTWSGDVVSTWDMLEKQIPAALNFTLMGISHWNSDIGGFFAGRWRNGGGTKNPEYQELYLRWMQFGAFCPMMRSHGTELPREIWQFGDKGTWCYDGIEKYINLRYSLLPYIYSTSWEITNNAGTFMRPMMMDFSKDKKTHDIGHQYMFGKSLLVAPVFKYNADKWSVYLPEDSEWYDFWTNEKTKGGSYINRDVPKDIIPVYVKTGSIIPFGPKVQYSTEKKWDNLDVNVYTGADGNFILFEDEFDNYNYESGKYTEITFSWDDKNSTFTIGKRKGNYAGMLENRNFNITLIKPGNEKISKTIAYTGKATSMKF